MSHNLLLKLLISSFIGLLFQISTAQEEISGKIYAARDSTALNAVSVYYDGTSIGTSTNTNGSFSIEKYHGEAPLIVSFLGYETRIIHVSSTASEGIPPIYLQEKQEELAEVIVEPDPWSRQKKLQIFRREFLGNTPEAQKSRIKNEKALQLYYSPSTNRLTAEATEPLIIINKHLGYKVRYDLESFSVQFSTGSSGLRLTHMVLYQGFSYFEELKERTRRKHLMNRKSTYAGSSLHFMRALAHRQLKENNFRIFHERFEVAPYKFFELRKTPDGLKVKLQTEKISILYGDLEQSGMQATTPFYIDSFGNHTPPTSVIFSGELSVKRIAHLLPLDYKIKTND